MLPRGKSSASSPPSSHGQRFAAGAEVEVRCDDEGFVGAWYEATVVVPRPNRTFAVTYTSIVADEDPSRFLTEDVPASHLRPRPPPPPPDTATRFAVHELVEAFHNDGWWPGVVSAVPGAGSGEGYRVSFPTTREEVDFETAAVRSRLRWARGRWSPPEEKVGRIASFKKGAEVEISGDKENFGVFWLPGIIDKVIGEKVFLVEYPKLKEGGGNELVKELLDIQYIRPKPSFLDETGKLASLTEVEVFYHGGWMVGVITMVLEDSKYIVKLKCPEEEMEFHHSELRIHREWISSKWCYASKAKRRGRPSSVGRKRSCPISVSSSSSSHNGGEKVKKRKKGDSKHQALMRISPRTLTAEDEFHVVNQNLESPVNKLGVSSPSDVLGLQQNVLSKELLNKRIELLTSDKQALQFHLQESKQQLKASSNQSSHASPDFLVAKEWGNHKGVRGHRSNSVRRIKKLAVRRPDHQGVPYIDARQHIKEYAKKRKSINYALPNIECNKLKKSEGTDPVAESDLRKDDPVASSEGVAPNRAAIISTQATDCSENIPSDIYHLKKCTGNGLQPERSTEPITECEPRNGLQPERSTEPITECEPRNEDASTSNQGVSQNKVVECKNSQLAADIDENAPDQDIEPNKHGATIPFAKTSSLWEQLESMEVFALMPQQPHFRQLAVEPVELREGMAIGLMVTFSTLVTNISKMRISDSDDILKERLKAISTLEENGFNVQSLNSRISELIYIRNNKRRLEEEKTTLEGQLVDRENEKEKFGALTASINKDIMEVEKHLACLREKRDLVVDQSSANETNIIRLRKDVQVLEEGVLTAEKHFSTLIVSPWQKETTESTLS